jgi:predicted acyltransferase
MLVASVGVGSVLIEQGQWEHTEWAGPHLIDLIFPVFVTLTGCGLAFALRRRVDPVRLVRRALILFVIGLLYNAVTGNQYGLQTWRIPGVLQLYAGIVLLVGLGHLVTKSWRGWLVITFVAAAAHSVLLGWWASGCPDTRLDLACNPSRLIDSVVFGRDHMLATGDLGHDPEGLVSLLGAFVSASAGAVVGHLLRPPGVSGTPEPTRAVGSVTAVAAGLVGAGYVLTLVPAAIWGYQIPMIKKLWTAPFALWIAAGTSVVLLAAHVVLDSTRTPAFVRGLTWPVRAMGLNSLFVYFGSHVIMALLWVNLQYGDQLSWAERIADAIAVDGYRQATWTVLCIGVWMSAAVVLHVRRIYLRP